MQFNEWVRELRKSQSITLVELAQQIGLTHAAISIIENRRSRPTLTSAKRLCEALGATPSDLVHVTQEREHLCYLEAEPVIQPTDTLHLQDVEKFLALYESEPEQGKELLAFLLNQIARMYPKGVKPTGQDQREFSVQNVEAIISDLPLHVSHLRSAPIELGTVLETLEHGGVLTSSDVAIYLTAAYERAAPGLEDPDSLHRVISSVKRRSADDLSVQVLLEDVLALDQALADEGEILAMFWRVAELGELLEDRSEREKRLVSTLITGYRWWQHLVGKGARFWLDELRSGIKEAKLILSNQVEA